VLQFPSPPHWKIFRPGLDPEPTPVNVFVFFLDFCASPETCRIPVRFENPPSVDPAPKLVPGHPSAALAAGIVFIQSRSVISSFETKEEDDDSGGS